jgi:hypothetical protein
VASANATTLVVGIGTVIWLIGAPVLGHVVWHEAPWILVMLFAGMAELIVLALWLVGSTLHDPVRRWELPPNPADAHRGWRGALARVRASVQEATQFLRQKLLRKAAKA